jgi:chromosome partitioning protein
MNIEASESGLITVIANLKGGSGKSTIAFNLGIWLQMKGECVVAYDLDPQQTLSDVSLVRNEVGTISALKVNQVDGVDVVSELNKHSCHVLVDVGAANMNAMKTAISIANRIIIPVPPSQPDVWATQRFLKVIHEVCDNKQPELIAFINRADTHCSVRESDEAEEALKMLGNIRVLSYRLCQRMNYRRTLSEGLSIFELAKHSKGAEEFELFAQALYPDLTN